MMKEIVMNHEITKKDVDQLEKIRDLIDRSGVNSLELNEAVVRLETLMEDMEDRRVERLKTFMRYQQKRRERKGGEER